MSTATRLAHGAFACSKCGATAPKWGGRCTGCGEWNSLAEMPRGAAPIAVVAPATSLRLTEIEEPLGRLGSGLAEVDRVLGGGFLPGSLVLLGGDPGIGKSTLALQVAAAAGTASHPALYCAGEESLRQVAMRARRLGSDLAALEVVAETDLDVLLATLAASRPPLAVIDSVQTLSDPAIAGGPGSVSQVRGAVGRLLTAAKSLGVSILLIGHVTKEGAIAGPRTLEHMVDVVLYLEGDRHDEQRILRGVKNRFGATGDVGLLSMEAGGIRELAAGARAFISDTPSGVAGTMITVTCEGIRPIGVEVQALTSSTHFGLPRRNASGFDIPRLHLLLAVLEQRAAIRLSDQDVYVNVAGGVRLADPAADLAVALAIASARRNRPLPPGTAAFGEIGLAGEVRRASRLEQRLQEAAGLGMARAFVPAGCALGSANRVRCIAVRSLGEALAHLV